MSDDYELEHRQLEAGQTWQCDESRADEPRHDWPENPFGSRYVRFRAVVDRVEGDYVELTTTVRNRHYAAPEPASEMAKSAETLRADPRWRQA